MSWISYAAKRTAIGGGVLFGASTLIYSIIWLVPGDPAVIVAGTQAPQETVDALREQMGLNDPVWQQYLVWLTDVAQGNFGQSLISGHSVSGLVAERYPRSLQLAITSMVISLIIALPLGIIGAVNHNSPIDYVALFFSQFGVSLPSFWFGIILILVFGLHFAVLPPSGHVPPTEDFFGFLQHVIMPATALGVINAAVITRFLRSEMLEELNKDYVRTARAFGHPRRRIVRKYVLKNAIAPTLTIIGLQFGYLIGGIVIIEQVFSYPGVGQLILDGLLNRDYPVVQAGLLVLAATFIFVNLIVDLTYGYLDPKIKY